MIESDTSRLNQFHGCFEGEALLCFKSLSELSEMISKTELHDGEFLFSRDGCSSYRLQVLK